MTCSWYVLFSHPFKTWPHCCLHSTKNNFFLHCHWNLNAYKHIREREGREEHAGKCHIFTWLRSCSKELSPDLLIDPELVSATLTRAAGNKVSGCVLFWRKQCIITINTICVFYYESQADTQTGPHLCILAADCRWTEQSEQFEEKQLKQNQPDYWNIKINTKRKT